MDSFNYLGLTIDQKLDFYLILSMVNLKLSFLAKIRRFITELTALTIFKATVLPILHYYSALLFCRLYL